MSMLGRWKDEFFAYKAEIAWLVFMVVIIVTLSWFPAASVHQIESCRKECAATFTQTTCKQMCR